MTIIVSIAALLAGFVTVPQTGSDVKPIVDAYLQIQALLAADKVEGIKPPAQAIATRAAALQQDGAAVVTSAKAVEAATDLKSAREAFGGLSDAVIALAKSRGVDADVKLVYCPMVRRSWLQKEPKIRNPYYGSNMLECGEFKDLKK